MLRVANDLRWGLENELELERSDGIMVDGGWWMVDGAQLENK